VWAVEGIILLGHTEQVIRQNALRSEKCTSNTTITSHNVGANHPRTLCHPHFCPLWPSGGSPSLTTTISIHIVYVDKMWNRHHSSIAVHAPLQGHGGWTAWQQELSTHHKLQHPVPTLLSMSPTYQNTRFESSAAVRIVHNSIRRHSSPKLDCQVVCHIVEN
jgi:hypothetical protein